MWMDRTWFRSVISKSKRAIIAFSLKWRKSVITILKRYQMSISLVLGGQLIARISFFRYSHFMKLIFIAVGKKHDPLVENGVAEFTARISRYTPVEWKIIPASNAEEEGEKFLQSISDTDTLVALDEKGKGMTTLVLAEYFGKTLSLGTKRLVFVIGGAYGLDQSIKARANLVWSLSALTFPHQLVRLLLSEQVYRAFTVIKGEKYHHEG